MEVRYVNSTIFENESDAVLFYIENSLLEDRSKILVKEAGIRILEALTKISGIESSEAVVIPGFDIKADYLILSNIREDLKSDFNKEIFKKSLINSFKKAIDFKISSINIDISYLQGLFGKEYVNIFNDLINSDRFRKEEIILYLCRLNPIDN